MKNLTRQFRRMMVENERNFLAYADITLSNNTVINLTNSELWSGGFSYEEAVSSDDEFTAIGSVIIGSAEIIINNIYEEYSEYDFTNADVVLYLGMQLEDRLEKFKIGTYRVDDTAYNGATIKLSLLDNIEQFDRPYSLSNLRYPATLFQIIQDACITCGVTLANNSLTFPHYNYSIPTRPNDESITFRQVLSWCAAIAGRFIKCNPDGELTLGWFDTTLLDDSANDLDGGTFNPWSDGTVYDGGIFNPWIGSTVYDGGDLSSDRNVHYITNLWSQNIAMDDVVITGVTAYVKDDSENAAQDILKYSIGTNEYKIEISDNDFITKTNAQEIVHWLGQQLIGLRFRKLNVSQLSDPAIESGDVGIVVDRKSNVYRALITRVAFTIGSSQTIICGASTPSRNNATKYSSVTKSYVESRKMLRREQSAREQAVEQLERAIEESSGLYTTIVTPQTGGNIYYLHDAPDLADAKVVWKMTSDAWAVTDDWQGTDAATTAAHKWNAGLTVDGTLITSILSAVGINANWINTGTISIGGTSGNKDGTLLIKNANGNTIVQMNKNGVTVNGGTISGGTISGGTISGGTISGGTINGSAISVGGKNNTSGSLEVKNNSNVRICRIDNGGIYFGNIATSLSSPNAKIDNSGTFYSTGTYSIAKYANGGLILQRAPSGPNCLYVEAYGYTTSGLSCRVYNTSGALAIGGSAGTYINGYLIGGNPKARMINTKNYSNRLLFCYETPTPYFGDIGTGKTDENGDAIIDLDDIFVETINRHIEYNIFLQKEGRGDIWVEEKECTHFVVKGTPNLKFSWEIKAVQIDAANMRLVDNDIRESGTYIDDDIGLNMVSDLEMLDQEVLFEEVI